MSRQAIKLLLSGAVQGCGIRPTLATLAINRGWSGRVRNTSSGVELTLCGNLPSDQDLLSTIQSILPDGGRAVEMICEAIPAFSERDFQIEDSESAGPLSAYIPRDVAICDLCLAETRDPENRRYGYSLISCSRCGPRYSILLDMPFDRDRTTLRAFPLCSTCHQEYNDPTDRRFHAQTIGCQECGPRVWSSDAISTSNKLYDAALVHASKVLMDGGIVALKGIGGYQLLADATSSAVVKELRKRKQRPEKPFAILCQTLNEVRRCAYVNQLEVETLKSPENPIVIVSQSDNRAIAPNVNPGLRDIGILLPTSAMHDRLLALVRRPLICTSGNIHDNPIIHTIGAAEHQLKKIADIFVHHDREIHQPCDDSVVRIIANRVATIRCARGLAPLPLHFQAAEPAIAYGGHQKSAIAISNGQQSWLGSHTGDLDSVAAREEWCNRLRQFTLLTGISTEHREPIQDIRRDLVGCTPHFRAYDAHPDYFPTQYITEKHGPGRIVWHHHAHVLAAMAEHGLLGQPVLGVAFDGSGFGPDATMWGGEFLIASQSGFRRIAHFRTYGLPGGEVAVKDIRRTAISLLTQLSDVSPDLIAHLTKTQTEAVLRLQKVLGLKQTIATSSCGRLFDAAANLILGLSHPTYEGQAAACLEAACDPSAAGEYPFVNTSDPCHEIDWRPMVRSIVEDIQKKVPASTMATRFHRSLCRLILSVVEQSPELPVVLCGGVFQNRMLVEMVAKSWSNKNRLLGLPGKVPVNDGGLAVGQLAVRYGNIG